MAEPSPGDEFEVPEKERARIRHRDRKRETRMVVDNAGVRRLLPAIATRRGKRSRDGRDPGEAVPR